METTIQPIRSFVRRERRLKNQAFPEGLWERYGINTKNPIILMDYFNCPNSVILEIGFGTGDTLFKQAQMHQDHGYIGIEVYKTGILRLLAKLDQNSLKNIRLIEGDAVTILSKKIPPNSVDNIQILFPDPWPKRRHHKRRLIQPAFVDILYRTLKPDGCLSLATDWEHYAYHMLNILEISPFINLAGPHQFSDRPTNMPLTKFEQRGKQLGHGIWHLVFKK